MSTVKIKMPELAPAPIFPVYRLKTADWKDGVVVRSPNWLGDAVMTLPALVQLKKILPEHCGLFVVCPPGLKDFYSTIPQVDKIICLHQAHRAWDKDDLRHVRQLRAGVGVLFNNSLRDAIYFRLARVRRLFGAAARGRSFLLTRNYKYPPRLDKHLNNLHHAEKYLSMVYALGAPQWLGEMPAITIGKPEELNCGETLTKVFSSDKVMTLAAGAAYGAAKRWPSDHFHKVSDYWIRRGGCVAILGSASENQIAEEISNGLPPEKCFNLAGATNLQQLMAVLKHSTICIANDSGIMHLSAAIGGRGIAIFGPTDPSSTSPVSADWNIVFEKQPCAPCFERVCPLGTARCMQVVTAEKIIKMLGRITADEK